MKKVHVKVTQYKDNFMTQQNGEEEEYTFESHLIHKGVLEIMKPDTAKCKVVQGNTTYFIYNWGKCVKNW